MNRVVVFTKNNARIVNEPSHHEMVEYSKMKNVLINPDLSKVAGVAPHYWTIGHQNSIVEMSDEEKKVRDQHIATFGAINSLEPLDAMPNPKEHIKWASEYAEFIVAKEEQRKRELEKLNRKPFKYKKQVSLLVGVLCGLAAAAVIHFKHF